jgi:hypothetical protein
MAKPRIFVSSTYYDLKHIRTSIEAFIYSFGYEPVLFESGDIFFSHEKPLEESCYNELQNCHMQILIIGGSYGSSEAATTLTEEEKKDQYSKFNSITRKEFEVANARNIPIYFFVDNGVLSEYSTYKRNRGNNKIVYAHVSSVNIFSLLDDIYSLHSGNYIKGFSRSEDITDWLKGQWAHLMAEFITKRTEQIELKKINNSVQELNIISNSLKAYTEAILNSANPAEFAKIKTEQDSIEKDRIIKRFCQNPLIIHLLDNTNLKDQELFEVFLASESLDDYIEKVLPRVTKKQQSTIVSLPGIDEAIDDYRILKDYVHGKISSNEYLNYFIKEKFKKDTR